MNLTGLGPGWWVPCRLPDGRMAIADAEDPAQKPVVAAIRRITRAGAQNRGERYAGSPEDYAVVAAWLDTVEPLPDGQLFVTGEAA